MEKTKGLTYKEACEAINEGKKVARPGFKGYWYKNPENGKFTIRTQSGKDISYGQLDTTWRNTLHDDWYIVEEQ